MTWLTMDTAIAMNFLSDQAGDNIFEVLGAEELEHSILAKPLPMLPMSPVSFPSLPRKAVAPQPSPAFISMQQRGLEMLSKDEELPPFPANMMPMPPNESPLSRSSSVYSTDSVESIDSVASRETSISQIVEMYTDLIFKVSSSSNSGDLQRLKSRAYRDTVASLMQRRFSSGDSLPLQPPVPQVPALSISKKHPVSAPTPNRQPRVIPQQTPGSKATKHSVLVSPLSDNENSYSRFAKLEGPSVPSPESPPIRPFSFTSVDIIGGLKQHDAPPTLPAPNFEASSFMQDISSGIRPTETSQTTHKANPTQSTGTTRYVRPHDIFDKRLPPHPKIGVNSQFAGNLGPNHNDRKVSTGSSQSDDHGGDHSMKTRIREKLSRQRESKGTNDQSGYSLRTGGPTLENTNSKDLSILLGPRIPQHREELPTLPATSFQDYLIARRSSNEKQKSVEETTRGREELQLIASQMQPRSSSHEPRKLQRRSRRSSKTSDTDDQYESHKRKNSFLAALGGARHSLTQTSADKRREKLKESIVVIGATHLSIDSALGSGKSLP